jgi:hypothetical protein
MNRFLKTGVLLLALASMLSGCMPGGPTNAYQAQYFNDPRPCQPGTHSQSYPNTQSYRCVLNP